VFGGKSRYFVTLFRGAEAEWWAKALESLSGSGEIAAQALAQGSYLLEDFGALFFVDKKRRRWVGWLAGRPPRRALCGPSRGFEARRTDI
jgi:hypothetical protein